MVGDEVDGMSVGGEQRPSLMFAAEQARPCALSATPNPAKLWLITYHLPHFHHVRYDDRYQDNGNIESIGTFTH